MYEYPGFGYSFLYCSLIWSDFLRIVLLSLPPGWRSKHRADSREWRCRSDCSSYNLHLPWTRVHSHRLLCQQWIHWPWTTGKPTSETRLHSGNAHTHKLKDSGMTVFYHGKNVGKPLTAVCTHCNASQNRSQCLIFMTFKKMTVSWALACINM